MEENNEIKQLSSKEKLLRLINYKGQVAIIEEEEFEIDRTIDRMTSLFINEILESLIEHNMTTIPYDLISINQFLYLINCNYYEKIRKARPNTVRELLIRNVMNQITLYLKITNQTTFDENDAKEALKSCIFLPESIRNEIALEFAHSKNNLLDDAFKYIIIRHDVRPSVKAYKEAKAEDVLEKCPQFDIEKNTNYESIINSHASYYASLECTQELSSLNPTDIKWDIPFLKTIMKTIAYNHRLELLEYEPHFSHFSLVCSFVKYAISYALVNNRKTIGQEEILNTFKEWDYIPFGIQLKVLDEVFEQEQIPYSKHPYQASGPQKQKQKVIKFKQQLENN